MYFHSMSFGIRAKLALCYIPTCSFSRVLDAGRSHNFTITIHNRNITLYAVLGRHGGRHLCHYYPPWQAICRQAKITLELINDFMKFQIIYIYIYVYICVCVHNYKKCINILYPSRKCTS